MIPAEKLDPKHVDCRRQKSLSSVLQLDKQRRRDNSFYKKGDDFAKNILLENNREARQKQIEERKKNRQKYRNQFSQLQKQFRKGKRLNEVRTANKSLREGARSEFTL